MALSTSRFSAEPARGIPIILGVLFCAMTVFGQGGAGSRGGFPGGGNRGGGGSQIGAGVPSNSGAGLPPVQAIPPLGVASTPFQPTPFAPQGFRGGFPGRGFAYPGYWGGAYVDYPVAPSPITNVVVIGQPSAPIAAPAPNPARPEIREYKFESGPADTSVSASDMQLFIVAMKDGSRQMASAVWAQGSDLQLIDENGAQKRVPLNSVDRQATLSLNRARNLNLRIP